MLTKNAPSVVVSIPKKVFLSKDIILKKLEYFLHTIRTETNTARSKNIHKLVRDSKLLLGLPAELNVFIWCLKNVLALAETFYSLKLSGSCEDILGSFTDFW